MPLVYDVGVEHCFVAHVYPVNDIAEQHVEQASVALVVHALSINTTQFLSTLMKSGWMYHDWLNSKIKTLEKPVVECEQLAKLLVSSILSFDTC